jgi:hypothetical protein
MLAFKIAVVLKPVPARAHPLAKHREPDGPARHCEPLSRGGRARSRIRPLKLPNQFLFYWIIFFVSEFYPKAQFISGVIYESRHCRLWAR